MPFPPGGGPGPRAVLATAFLVLAGLLIFNGPAPPVAAQAGAVTPQLARGSRIPWQDGSYFLSGVNYPYYRYYGGDIATLASVDQDCIWYYDSAFDYTTIDQDFADMQANGVHVVRWWLFGDGRGAPEFDGSGKVTGLDTTFFSHMDQALAIAHRHNIYLIWSLWDFLAFEHANWLCGGTGLAAQQAAAAQLPPAVREAYLAHLQIAQHAPAAVLPSGPGARPTSGQQCLVFAGGHRNLVTDTSTGGAQDSFFANALIPMLQRYAGNANIVGWEIMNEPEWTLNQNPYTGQNPTVSEPVDVAQMQAFFRRFTQAVHQYAPTQYATVGSASLKFMGFGQYLTPGIWNGLGFDYYGAHYYGWMDSQPYNNGNPLAIDYNNTATQLDAPVVIGEFPAHGGTAPLYLPSVRQTGTETSTLSLRYICTAYTPANDPPCTRPYTATVEYDDLSGAQTLTQSITLPPYGGWNGTVPATGVFSGTAKILSNGPLAAVITETGILSAGEQTAYTGPDKADTQLWLPRVTNTGPARTRLAVQNTDVHTTSVTISYYSAAGVVSATDVFTLGPRGAALIDPLLGGLPAGPPLGFQGSAIIASTSAPLVAVAALLDPTLGSDSYGAEPQGYLNAAYLPSVRNWGSNGDPTLYVQNPCCAATVDTIRYYNSAGALVATQTLSLPLYGAAVVQPQDVLTGGFEGTAILTSDQHPAAVLRSVANTSTVVYAGTQNPDQRLQFPVVHSLNGDGSGQVTSLSAQNVNPTKPINLWITLNDYTGTISGTYFYSTTVAPLGQWTAATTNLPGVPAGFRGTAEILWPYASGWNEGFPLVAVARDLDAAHTNGSSYRGAASHTFSWAVTAYQPRQLLEGIYANHWAGALAWSYYDNGTGSWADYQEASAGFAAAHPADVAIGSTLYTPVPTPGNSGTATAAAATPTTAYGNSATATAQAALTGTPQPTCAVSTTPVISPTPCTLSFVDVPSTTYFYVPVQYLACHGVISGYANGDGTFSFRPYNNTTRGQMVKIVVGGFGLPTTTPPAGNYTFADVRPTFPFFTVIETAVQANVVSGYACGGPGEPCDGSNRPYFRPYNNVTRGQLSKITVVAAAWALQTPPAGTFADVLPGTAFYSFVETAYCHGVISGYSCGGAGEPCDGQNRPYFRQFNNAIRGQIAKIVYGALTNGQPCAAPTVVR